MYTRVEWFNMSRKTFTRSTHHTQENSLKGLVTLVWAVVFHKCLLLFTNYSSKLELIRERALSSRRPSPRVNNVSGKPHFYRISLSRHPVLFSHGLGRHKQFVWVRSDASYLTPFITRILSLKVVALCILNHAKYFGWFQWATSVNIGRKNPLGRKSKWKLLYFDALNRHRWHWPPIPPLIY